MIPLLLGAAALAAKKIGDSILEDEEQARLRIEAREKLLDQISELKKQSYEVIEHIDAVRSDIEKELLVIDKQRLEFCINELGAFLGINKKLININFQDLGEELTREQYEERIQLYESINQNAQKVQKAIEKGDLYSKVSIFENCHLLSEKKLPRNKRERESIYIQSNHNQIADWYHKGIKENKNGGSWQYIGAPDVQINGKSFCEIVEKCDSLFSENQYINLDLVALSDWEEQCENIKEMLEDFDDYFSDDSWKILKDVDNFYTEDGCFWKVDGEDSLYASYHRTISDWVTAKWDNSFALVLGILKIHTGVDYRELSETEKRSLFDYWRCTDAIMISILNPIIDNNGMLLNSFGEYFKKNKIIKEIRNKQEKEINRIIKQKCRIKSNDMNMLFTAMTIKTIIEIYEEAKKTGQLTAKEGDELVKDKLNNKASKVTGKDKRAYDIYKNGVPYDVIKKSKELNVAGPGKGLSGNTHRELTLGHDPVLGWFFGVVNILTSTCTVSAQMVGSKVKSNIVNILARIKPLKRIAAVSQITKKLVVKTYEIQNGEFVREILTIDAVKQAFEMIHNDKKLLVCALVKQYYHIQSDYRTKKGIRFKVLSKIPGVKQLLPDDVESIWNDCQQLGFNKTVDLFIWGIRKLTYDAKIDGDKENYDFRTKQIITWSDNLVVAENLVASVIKKDATNINWLQLVSTFRENWTDIKKRQEIKEKFRVQIAKKQGEEDSELQPKLILNNEQEAQKLEMNVEEGLNKSNETAE